MLNNNTVLSNLFSFPHISKLKKNSQKTRKKTRNYSLLCSNQQKCFRLEEFFPIKKLGEGSYGKVYLVQHIPTGFLLAMKIIEKNYLISDNPEQDERTKNQLIRQVKIQMFCNHRNIAKLYSFFADATNFYLLMEFGSDGNLFSTIKRSLTFSEEATSILAREILSGISYLHSNFIIHRDLKLQNIVLVHGTAKICDFGCSIYCPQDVMSTFCGTPLYLSPEVLKGHVYNEKIDSWAFGTLVFELFTGQNPFKIQSSTDLHKIIKEDLTVRCGSKAFQHFIEFILVKDIERRPSMLTIERHPFIKKYKQLETHVEIGQKMSIRR